MQFAPDSLESAALRGPEQRLIGMLRDWCADPDPQETILADLSESLGPSRARACLQAFEQMLTLLTKHGWHSLVILRPNANGYSQDELSIARFVMAATEQRRDVAVAEASFLVSPDALLPLLCAGARVGLPLLCEECRARIRGLDLQA